MVIFLKIGECTIMNIKNNVDVINYTRKIYRAIKELYSSIPMMQYPSPKISDDLYDFIIQHEDMLQDGSGDIDKLLKGQVMKNLNLCVEVNTNSKKVFIFRINTQISVLAKKKLHDELNAELKEYAHDCHIVLLPYNMELVADT